MMNAAVDRLLGKLAAAARGGESESLHAVSPRQLLPRLLQIAAAGGACGSQAGGLAEVQLHELLILLSVAAGVCVSELLKGMSMDVIGDTGGFQQPLGFALVRCHLCRRSCPPGKGAFTRLPISPAAAAFGVDFKAQQEGSDSKLVQASEVG
jgi:hypothetical protein